MHLRNSTLKDILEVLESGSSSTSRNAIFAAAGTAAGIAAGLAIGFFFAPSSGRQLRSDLRSRASRMRRHAHEHEQEIEEVLAH